MIGSCIARLRAWVVRGSCAALTLVLWTAATPAWSVERYHGSTLKWVYPLNNGDFVLGFNVDSPSCTASGSPKYMYVSVGQNGITSEGAKKIYAAATVALVANLQVNIAFDDATVYCHINRLTISN